MTVHDHPTRCRWNGESRVTSEHDPACDTTGCEGCLPCDKRHCAMPRCSKHLSDQESGRCASCVGKVRAGLERLVVLTEWAPTVAAAARRLTAPEVDLAAPVADPAAYSTRRSQAMTGALCRCTPGTCPDQNAEAGDLPQCPELAAWLDTTEGDDEKHPQWVLSTWDALVAEHLFGEPRSLRPTIQSAVAFIGGNLTDLARDHDFPFDELATEIAESVSHVEAILAIAPHTQKGAPCPVCRTEGRKPKNLERRYANGEPDDAADLWKCPSSQCGQTWTVKQYKRFIEQEHLQHADKLTASDLAREYRIPEGSIRGWASTGKLRRRGKDQAGRVLYDVADALKQRDKNARPDTQETA